jgi:WD40 repeat protein
MSLPDELKPIFDRIAQHQQTATDMAMLRQHLSTGGQFVSQQGKYAVNLGQGQDIHIGDRIYQGIDAEAIKDVIRDLLRENQPLPGQSEPPKQTWRYLHILKGHDLAITALVISDNGQVLVSGSADRTIRIWCLRTMQLLRQISSGSIRITALAISLDGQLLISGSSSGSLKFWQLSSGERVHTIRAAHDKTIHTLAITPNGQQLITGGADRTLKQWDLKTQSLLQTLDAGQTAVTAIAISPDGQFLISGSQGGTLRIWRLPRGELKQILAGMHAHTITGLVIPNNSQEVISTSSDGTVKQLNRLTGELLYTFDHPKSAVRSLAIAQGASILVTGCDNGSVQFWQWRSRELVYFLEAAHWSAIRALAITTDGRTCITGSQAGHLKVWRQ